MVIWPWSFSNRLEFDYLNHFPSWVWLRVVERIKFVIWRLRLGEIKTNSLADLGLCSGRDDHYSKLVSSALDPLSCNRILVRPVSKKN